MLRPMADAAIVPLKKRRIGLWHASMNCGTSVNGCRKTIEALDRLIATESQPAALAPPDVALFSFGLCILIAHTHCSMNPLACDHSLPRGMHLFSELQELRLYGGHPLPVSLEGLNHRL